MLVPCLFFNVGVWRRVLGSFSVFLSDLVVGRPCRAWNKASLFGYSSIDAAGVGVTCG